MRFLSFQFTCIFKHSVNSNDKFRRLINLQFETMKILQLNFDFQPKKVNFQKYNYCLNPRLFNDETFAFALQSDATVPLLASECILALAFFAIIFFSLLFIYGSFKHSRVASMSSKTRNLQRRFYWAIGIQVSNFQS